MELYTRLQDIQYGRAEDKYNWCTIVEWYSLYLNQKGRSFERPFKFVPRGTMCCGLWSYRGLCSLNCSTWNCVEHFWFYLPNFTNNTLTSAGETPGIRDACPIVAGRIRVSFWRASIVSEFIEWKSKSSGMRMFSSLWSFSAMNFSRSI